MAELGAMSYSRPSSYTGYQSGYKPVDRSIPNAVDNPYNFSPDDFWKKEKEKKKDKDGINLWDVLSGTIGQPSGVVTSGIYNALDKLFDKDTPIWEKAFNILNPLNAGIVKGVKNGAKEQWKDWTDGDLSWGDIPMVGFLHGMDKGHKRGQDILEDMFKVENRWGKVGGGIAIDIAADPLTYLTGGVSAASKLKKAAELAEMASQASKIGAVGKFKNTDDLLKAAEQTLRTKYAKYPNLVDKMVTKKLDEITKSIRGAGAKAYNDNINKLGFGIPFTSKMGLGDMPTWMPTYRTEATVGRELLDNLLNGATFGNHALKQTMEQVIKTRYGIDDLSKLTKTQFDDLHKVITPVVDKMKNQRSLPDVITSQRVVDTPMNQDDFTKLMDDFTKQNVPWKDVQKQLDEILAQVGDNATLRSSYGSQLANMVSDFWTNKPAKNFSGAANARKAESMAWASKFLKESDVVKKVQTTVDDIFPTGSPKTLAAKDANDVSKMVNQMLDTPYTGLNNAKTKFEHFLDRKNPFDARTLATGDKFLDSMANHISDAQSQRVGENAMFEKALSGIEKFVKKNKVTDDQMKETIYYLEGKFPDSYGANYQPSSVVKQLANKIRPLLDDVAKNEQSGGVLDNLRANYFPHVVNKTDDDISQIQDFISRHPEFGELSGLSSSSGFNKSRKSFDTMADKDNYISKLEKAIQKETDSATIESLRKQQELVANLFDTNVVTALTRRVREGVRAKAMKAMQKELSKFGMMKTVKKGSGDDVPTGLTRLEPDEAKKLGLGEGTHHIHPKVLEGLKRVDEIFTNQNMNKAARMVAATGDIWRPLVTYYKPAHYVNNIIGNTINNLAAGVRPKDVASATKLIKKYRSGKLSDDEMKIIKAAYKHNVISGGFLFDSRPTWEFDNPTALEKFADKLGNNKAIRKIRNVGEIADDISRLANYLNGMHKFGSSAKAAEQVRTYLFNYNELTNADRSMRVLVPFWNWTKRNIPLQMKILMENPQFPLNVERFKNLFNDGEKGQDWQKESGIKVSDDYYTGLPSPTHDLGMLLNPKQLLSSTTPALRMPLEVAYNKKTFTGNPISYGSDNVQAEDMLGYIMSNLGVGNNAYKAFTDEETSTFEHIMGMLKPVSKIREE